MRNEHYITRQLGLLFFILFLYNKTAAEIKAVFSHQQDALMACNLKALDSQREWNLRVPCDSGMFGLAMVTIRVEIVAFHKLTMECERWWWEKKMLKDEWALKEATGDTWSLSHTLSSCLAFFHSLYTKPVQFLLKLFFGSFGAFIYKISFYMLLLKLIHLSSVFSPPPSFIYIHIYIMCIYNIYIQVV